MAGTSKVERAIVDAIDEAALVIDGATVRIANDAARSLLGRTVEGRDVRLAVRHPRVLDHILTARRGDVDAVGIGEPGRSWQVSIRPIGGTSVLVRMIDRSQSVSAERMRVDFVANASHELRTPLSAVIGYAETLAEEQDLDEGIVARFGGTIRSEARRMLRIVEDLMSLSRIEADRFRLPNERIDLHDVLNASIANCTTNGVSTQCRVTVAGDEGEALVRGDRAQLIQLFDNLLSNAIRYGCESPGDCVSVGFSRRGTDIVVAIKDKGPGIARQHLPRLTERFYRVDDARSRESGGTGLGLAIVKHIVERHRGTLDIESTLGVGTSVTVRLPDAG